MTLKTPAMQCKQLTSTCNYGNHIYPFLCTIGRIANISHISLAINTTNASVRKPPVLSTIITTITTTSRETRGRRMICLEYILHSLSKDISDHSKMSGIGRLCIFLFLFLFFGLLSILFFFLFLFTFFHCKLC